MGVESAIGSLGSASGILLADLSATDQVLSPHCRAIMVGVAGNVKVTMVDGSVGVLPALQPGVIYPVIASLIWKTGTTATSVTALL